MEEEWFLPSLLIVQVAGIIHIDNSWITDLGDPTSNYVSKNYAFNLRLTLSKIYKNTTIYMFNKSHLLKAQRYSIKIHTFYVYSKYNLIKEIKNSDTFRLLY